MSVYLYIEMTSMSKSILKATLEVVPNNYMSPYTLKYI